MVADVAGTKTSRSSGTADVPGPWPPSAPVRSTRQAAMR